MAVSTIPPAVADARRKPGFLGVSFRFTLPADNRARRLSELVPGINTGQYVTNVTVRNEDTSNSIGVGPGGTADARIGATGAITMWTTDPAEVTFNSLGNAVTVSVWVGGSLGG